jgi:hypothetical protein
MSRSLNSARRERPQSDLAPSPAWLRQFRSPRYPLAGWACAQADYRTAAYLTTCKPASRRSVTLLKPSGEAALAPGSRSKPGWKIPAGPAYPGGQPMRHPDPRPGCLAAARLYPLRGRPLPALRPGIHRRYFVNGDLVGPSGSSRGGEQVRMGTPPSNSLGSERDGEHPAIHSF